MKKLIPLLKQSQRDSKWSSQLLGNNTQSQYDIGNFGCLITSLGNYIGQTPIQINTHKNMFVKGGGDLIWTEIGSIGLTQTYASPRYNDAVPDTALNKMRSCIDSGYPLIVEVDFYPSTLQEDMHWVLVIGYGDGETFYAIDPWTGTEIDLAVYGGVKRTVYSFRTYDKTLPLEELSTSEIIVGNDVSEFQVDIDWNTYKNNTNFVIIRSTYGTGEMDTKFTKNREGARNAGIPLGFYHYAYPHLNTALAEADWCLLQLSDIREQESIYLDFEEDKVADPVTWCKAFLDRIAEKRNGYKALIYLNQNLCKKYDWSPIVNAGYKLWIAAYTYNPRLNNYATGAWPTAAMQQWTDQQQVPGISGNVDGDVFFGNIQGFKDLGYKTPVVTPPPADTCETKLTDCLQAVKNINQQVSDLNSLNASLQVSVSNQEKLLLDNQSTIATLTAQAEKVGPLTEQVNDLTDSVLKRDGEISTLKTQNGKLTKDLADLKAILIPKKYFSLALYKIAMKIG